MYSTSTAYSPRKQARAADARSAAGRSKLRNAAFGVLGERVRRINHGLGVPTPNTDYLRGLGVSPGRTANHPLSNWTRDFRTLRNRPQIGTLSAIKNVAACFLDRRFGFYGRRGLSRYCVEKAWDALDILAQEKAKKPEEMDLDAVQDAIRGVLDCLLAFRRMRGPLGLFLAALQSLLGHNLHCLLAILQLFDALRNFGSDDFQGDVASYLHGYPGAGRFRDGLERMRVLKSLSGGVGDVPVGELSLAALLDKTDAAYGDALESPFTAVTDSVGGIRGAATDLMDGTMDMLGEIGLTGQAASDDDALNNPLDEAEDELMAAVARANAEMLGAEVATLIDAAVLENDAEMEEAAEILREEGAEPTLAAEEIAAAEMENTPQEPAKC